MKLDNHIAYRFLTDDNLMAELVLTQYPKYKPDIDPIEDAKVMTLCDLIRKENQKAYWITDTVLSKLGMLKVKRRDNKSYDWTVFSKLKDQKVTFVFPNNSLLRMQVINDNLCFCYTRVEKWYNKEQVELNWVLFFLNRFTGELCDHFQHPDVKEIEEFVYKLLCFMYLSDNTEVVLEAGRKMGTKKSGKLINTLPIPLTIVDSNWNVTSIRTEGFDVSGHFAIRWVGEGRHDARMVFIEPFKKEGYTRKAKQPEA